MSKDDWDHAMAQRLEGALVLVGLAWIQPEGKRQEQFFGTVMAVDPRDGVTLRLEGRRAGEIYRLPPDLEAFEAAAPGSYRLSETGEFVDDPDFTSTWTLTPPKN